MKYNYVFFLPNNDYYWICYSDLAQLDNCKVFRDIKNQIPILSVFSRIHLSQKINNIIELPFKSLWHETFYDISFTQKRPLCFVFFVGILEPLWKRKFVEYLKRKYPEAKFVGYYADLVNAPHRILLNKPEVISHFFDLLINYDREDASKYGMLYYPTSYSNIAKIENNEICDVYFLGKAKDRLKKIFSIYEQLTLAGLKCDFYLVGVPEESKVQKKGLNYIDNMPYNENLRHIQSSRCILELLQKGAVGYTVRTWESIQFDKGLITDNLGILSSNYYNEHFVSVIKDGVVDVDYVKGYKAFRNPLKEKIRPKEFLLFLEKCLTEQSI